MEAIIRKQSRYARTIIEASRDSLFTIGMDGKITDINKASLNMTEESREQLIGSDFFSHFTEPEKAREIYKKIFAEGFVIDFPLTISDDKLTDVLFNGTVYKDENGKVLGIVVMARDITEQKWALELQKANKKLAFQIIEKEKRVEELKGANYARSLIEASIDPLVTISAEGKITDVNEASSKVTGIPRKKLINTDFSNYFIDPNKAQEVYQRVFEKGIVEDYPLTIKHKNGKLTDVLYNASVYKDENGNVLGVFAAARDITEQKRNATELTEAIIFAEKAKNKAEKAAKVAEDAVKAKQQFLSNMSHEIRTPMNAIIGFTKVLLKTSLTAKQEDYLNAIKLSGDALTVLINDILDLAKVDAGKMTFESTPFNMAASISAMIHVFATKIQEKNIKLIKKYDAKIPKVLVGDSVRLNQIVLNLLSNAVKFTSAGSITVSVKLMDTDKEKSIIKFSVADTGIGIPEDKMEHIFENFQQASSETSRIYGGTGLGLAISKHLVESQGGKISVKSKANKGSTFCFVLPFQNTDEHVGFESEIIELNLNLKNIKVLVVEDIILNQLLMKTLLDDFGFMHDIAGNGKIAIEKLEKIEYDIILMDLQMPIMNGFEATNFIRNTMGSNVPIIALTADVTTADLRKCTAVGMNDYISKPVDDEQLYKKIIELIPIPIKKSEIKPQKNIIPIPLKKCIDLTYMKHRTKSNSHLMMEMINIYLKQTPSLIKEMQKSLTNEDWDSLYSATHKLISSFTIVGIHKDYENMAKQVQEYSNTKLHLDKISELVPKIASICTQACAELKQEYTLIKKMQ